MNEHVRLLACDRFEMHKQAELVTDDKAALREQLQALTGERIAALEGSSRRSPGRARPSARRIGAPMASAVRPCRRSVIVSRSPRAWIATLACSGSYSGCVVVSLLARPLR